MDKNYKKELISNFLDSIKSDIIKKIDTGDIPENWDGIELKELVKDIAINEVYYFNNRKKDTRYKEYRKIAINKNLY